MKGPVEPTAVHPVGCVSFLNSKPLIEGVLAAAERERVAVKFAVPSQLLELFERGAVCGGVSTALMSVVDYQGSATELVLVPAGMIGCDGPTLTVRIFSRVPVGEIQVLHGDTDSHTSIVLAKVVLKEKWGIEPEVRPLVRGGDSEGVEAMVLIGDKVVNAAPSREAYPYQVDLGEAWKGLTGLPFVFAMWMMRKDVVERDRAEAVRVGQVLAEARRRGAGMTDALLEKYAAEKGWPCELARRYFTEYLRYEVTDRARAGLAAFFERAGRLGFLQVRRPLEYLELGGA